MKKKLAVLSLIILLAAARTSAQEKEGPESGGIKIKGAKETLVARDIDRGGEGFYTMKWCGNRGLIFRSKNSGVGLIDFHTKERIRLDLTLSYILSSCTSDGKRLLYRDAASMRYGEEIYDLYVYNIETNDKTIVASVRTLSDNALSPDGTKLLLGERHRKVAREVGEEEWEDVRFSKNWNSSYDAKWFKDSKGVVTFGKEYSNFLCIELFGKEGWAECFDLQVAADMLKTDGVGRIYYLEGHPTADDHFLNQCEIKAGDLNCKRILEDYDVFRTYDFLPDGDIVFIDYDHDECIRRATPGEETAGCVIGLQYGDAVYDGIGLIGVSPDGRWLAFDRSNKIIIPGREAIYWQSDLFLMDLEDGQGGTP